MKNIYYETIITPSANKDEIINFLIERFNNGIEEKNNSLILRSDEKLDDLIEELKKYVSALEEIFNEKIDIKIDVKEESNKDWIENYKNSIKPVEIDEFYIYPSWYPPMENKINILIDPALAFGSGHHETTRSCVKALKKYVNENKKVLDVGCGSGILGIVSAKLGAEVDACDTDPLAVRSAKENYELNKVKYRNIWEGSAVLSSEKYDVVVANIIADVLIFISNDLKSKVNDVLILSGIIDKYKDKVLKKYQEFELIDEIKENEWVTLVLRKEIDE